MPDKIRCLAIDDEPIALAKLNDYIARTPFLELAGSCENAFEALELITAGNIDAIFVDINMPGLNGIDLLASLPKNILAVFTTAYAEYAVDAYRHNAVDYLLKPFDFASFQRAAVRVLERFRQAPAAEPASSAETIFVKTDYRYVGVHLRDIIYIRGLSEYVRIFINGQKPLTALLSMREVMARMPANFIQVHRSFIVNTDHITEIARNRLQMSDGEYISVSDNFRTPFADYIRAHALEKPKNNPS